MSDPAGAPAAMTRKDVLGEQLRAIDEACDTAAGEREPEDDDLPYRVVDATTVEVQIGETWYEVHGAIEMTRAALFDVDTALHDAGIFAERES